MIEEQVRVALRDFKLKKTDAEKRDFIGQLKLSGEPYAASALFQILTVYCSLDAAEALGEMRAFEFLYNAGNFYARSVLSRFADRHNCYPGGPKHDLECVDSVDKNDGSKSWDPDHVLHFYNCRRCGFEFSEYPDEG